MGNMTRLRNLEYIARSRVPSPESRVSRPRARSLVVSRWFPSSLSFRAERAIWAAPVDSGYRLEARDSRFLPRKQAAFAEDFFAEFGFQAVAEEEAGIGGVADAEVGDGVIVQAAARPDIRGRERLRGGAGTPEKIATARSWTSSNWPRRRASLASPGVE